MKNLKFKCMFYQNPLLLNFKELLCGYEVITSRETSKKPRYNILQLFFTSECTRELQYQGIQSESTPGSYLI